MMKNILFSLLIILSLSCATRSLPPKPDYHDVVTFDFHYDKFVHYHNEKALSAAKEFQDSLDNYARVFNEVNTVVNAHEPKVKDMRLSKAKREVIKAFEKFYKWYKAAWNELGNVRKAVNKIPPD
jgi:glutamine synthetase type III